MPYSRQSLHLSPRSSSPTNSSAPTSTHRCVQFTVRFRFYLRYLRGAVNRSLLWSAEERGERTRTESTLRLLSVWVGTEGRKECGWDRRSRVECRGVGEEVGKSWFGLGDNDPGVRVGRYFSGKTEDVPSSITLSVQEGPTYRGGVCSILRKEGSSMKKVTFLVGRRQEMETGWLTNGSVLVIVRNRPEVLRSGRPPQSDPKLVPGAPRVQYT